MDTGDLFGLVADAAVKATALLTAALLVSRLLRAHSAALRYVVVTSAVAAILLVPALGLVLPRVTVSVLPPAEDAAGSPRDSERDVPAETAPIASGAAESPGIEGIGDPMEARPVTPAAVGATVPATPAAAPDTLSADDKTQVASPDAERSWISLLLVAAWLIGAVLVAVRVGVRHRMGRWQLRHSAPVEDADWLHALRGSAARLGVARPVKLLWSDSLDVPVTFGVVYPVLVVPASASEWPADRRRAVLDHELAHVRRFDALTQWLGELASVLYWFHPLVWIATREMHEERERACDDHVLNTGVRASDYARDLLEIASALAPATEQAAALAMARRTHLEGRLMALLDPDLDRKSVSRFALASVLLVTAALLVPVAAVEAGA